MAEKRLSIPSQIPIKEMKNAIQKSGYLLEQRVEPIIEKEGYYVQTNPVFPDSETGKSREIDLSAISWIQVYKDIRHNVFPILLCECENNNQPVVFFTKESPISFMHHEQVKVSGIPMKFWEKENCVRFSEFTGMEKFHHYCKGLVATQYCTFQLKKDKSSWMALHNEEQHDTFNSLIKALEYEITQHFDIFEKGAKRHFYMNIQIYYPLLILQGDLYAASIENDGLSLRKSKHIQFRKEFFLPRTNKVETYQIDVISEEYLVTYLKMIKSEVLKIKNVFQRKRNEVLYSIGRIREEAQNLKKKPESYREYLEF